MSSGAGICGMNNKHVVCKSLNVNDLAEESCGEFSKS